MAPTGGVPHAGAPDAEAPDAATPGAAAAQGGWTIETAAAELLACERERRDREPFTDEWPQLDLDTGYAIQDLNLRERVARGETVVGLKLGLTSRAKQERMGVDTPVLAWLTDAMVLPAGDPVRQDAFIHPRVEPEIVFVMGQRLQGPGVTAAQAMSAVESVWAGAEVIDSRYRDFRFTAGDVTADNASTAAFVTGPVGVAPDELDLTLEAVLVAVDGVVVDSATGAAVQGHPGEALALAANELARRGLAIEAGWLVLTGGMTDAVPVTPTSAVTFEFTNLGSVSVHMTS